MTTPHSVPAHALGSVPAPRHDGWAQRWAWAPALLLVSLIGTQLGVLASVLDDPTFSTEPDYYRKAVDWDTHMAQARQSQALGWSARARVEPTAPWPSRALVVTLTDAHGLPVSGARVQALFFHNAHAAQARSLLLVRAAPGEYRSALDAERPGVWELRLAAERGAEHYETTLRLELASEATEQAR